MKPTIESLNATARKRFARAVDHEYRKLKEQDYHNSLLSIGDKMDMSPDLLYYAKKNGLSPTSKWYFVLCEFFKFDPNSFGFCGDSMAKNLAEYNLGRGDACA